MELHRRTLVGVGTMVAVAGCLDQNDAEPEPTADPDLDPDPDPEITLVAGRTGEYVDGTVEETPHVEPPDSIGVTLTFEYENIQDSIQTRVKIRDMADDVVAESSRSYDPTNGSTTITHEIPVEGISPAEYEVEMTVSVDEVSDLLTGEIIVMGDDDLAVLEAIDEATALLDTTITAYRDQGDGETITSVNASTTEYSWAMRTNLEAAHESLDEAEDVGFDRHADRIERIRAEIDFLYDVLLFQRDIVRRFRTIDSLIHRHASYADFEEIPVSDDLRDELTMLESDHESVGADANYLDEYGDKLEQFATELDDIDVLAESGEDYAAAGSTLAAAASGYDDENFAIAFSIAQDAQEELAAVLTQLEAVASDGFQGPAETFRTLIEDDIDRAETIEDDAVDADE